MMGSRFPRGVGSIRLLAGLGRKRGLTASAVLRGSGVREAELDNPHGVVSAEQELQVIGNLVTQIDQQALGLEAGTLYHYTAFGPLGLAMASSAHARQALDLALKYFRLTYALTDFFVEDDGIDTLVTIDAAAVPPALRRFVVERDAAAVVTVCRDLFSHVRLLKGMEFSGPAPEILDPYVALFGFAPKFAATRDRAIIRNDQIFPLAQENELARRAAEAQCKRLLAETQARQGLVGRVRERLLRPGAQRTSMATIARDLCMTPRTLRRQLLNEGATFTAVQRQISMGRARELLTASAHPIDAVAADLGYASTTAFINAFKRDHGATPNEYRRQHRFELNHLQATSAAASTIGY